MHDLRDYKTLTPKLITAAISQLNHNTVPKIMTHLAMCAAALLPLRSNRARVKARQLLRRVKKAHRAGRIPLELTVTVRAAMPWLVLLVLFLILVTYVPWISLVLPNLLGM